MNTDHTTPMSAPAGAAEPRTITFSWVARGGAHFIENIKPSRLEQRTKEAFAKRLKAEAWLEPSRKDIVAQVFKRDGKWLWWCESLGGKVVIKCPKCGVEKKIDKDPSDPAETVLVETRCPKCAQHGGFEEVNYFDVFGNQLVPECRATLTLAKGAA